MLSSTSFHGGFCRTCIDLHRHAGGTKSLWALGAARVGVYKEVCNQILLVLCHVFALKLGRNIQCLLSTIQKVQLLHMLLKLQLARPRIECLVVPVVGKEVLKRKGLESLGVLSKKPGASPAGLVCHGFFSHEFPVGKHVLTEPKVSAE